MTTVTKQEKINGLNNICDLLDEALQELSFFEDYEEEYALLDSMANDFYNELAKLTTEVGDTAEVPKWVE